MSLLSQRWQLCQVWSSLLIPGFSHCPLLLGKGGEKRSPALQEAAGCLWIQCQAVLIHFRASHRFHAGPGCCRVLWAPTSENKVHKIVVLTFEGRWLWKSDLNYGFRKGERENNEHLTAMLITPLAATGVFLMHQVFVHISDLSISHIIDILEGLYRNSTHISSINTFFSATS